MTLTTNNLRKWATLLLFCALQTMSLRATAQEMNTTAKDMLRLMTPGWNLGNTLEAGDKQDVFSNRSGLAGETAWQATPTNEEIIKQIKRLGFRSVRLPVAWVMGHVSDSTECKIDPAWMNRIETIVDYCVDNGLYVVLNDHWDGGWLENSFKKDISPEAIARNSETLRKLWTQIATRFRNYDERLLFAGLNEPEIESQEQMEALLRYEQVFIDAVRATGGNNAQRVLIIQTPSTDIDKAEKWMTRLPKDTVKDRLMVEVHFYAPYQFALMDKDADWGKCVYYWGEGNHVDGNERNASWGEEAFVKGQFLKVKHQFVDKGFPVLLGEYGANWKDVSSMPGEHQANHDASVKAWYRCVTAEAIKCGMVPMVWDINYPKMGSMTLLDRNSLKVHSVPAYEGMLQGLKDAGF